MYHDRWYITTKGRFGGAIVVSPLDESSAACVGFVGRCLVCPNPELISFEQLQAAVPEYHFRLWPEWHNWSR